MKRTKLNKNWNSNPNNSEVKLSLEDDILEVRFLLDSSAFEHIDEGESGKLKFYNIHAYRTQVLDKKEYLDGKFRFSNKQLPWGDFYDIKVQNSIKDFPKDQVLVDEASIKNELRHFVFFLNDQVIECLATDCKFEYELEEVLETKYAKGYMSHYLSVFASQFKRASVDNFRLYTGLYLQMHNKKEFVSLKEEIRSIKMNNDQELFIKLAKQLGIPSFNEKELKVMLTVIKNYKV